MVIDHDFARSCARQQTRFYGFICAATRDIPGAGAIMMIKNAIISDTFATAERERPETSQIHNRSFVCVCVCVWLRTHSIDKDVCLFDTFTRTAVWQP